jgi:single-strand DNA-binding protein
MQTLLIAGNVGNVKEIKDVGGDKVLNFSIAVDNGKDKNGEKREPTWYECALWGKRAESLAPYIAKGSKLAVSGRPSARAHEGKAYLGLTVNELTFMSSKADNERSSERAASSGDDYSSGFSTGDANKPSGPRESYDLNDDIPF